MAQFPPIDPDQVLAGLQAQHPRLLLTPGRLAELRQEIAQVPRVARWYASIQDRADALGANPPREAVRDRRKAIPSRTMMEWALVTALVGAITQDQTRVGYAIDALEHIVKTPDWRYTQHHTRPYDLGSAEICVTLGLARDWLHPWLSPDTHARIERWLIDSGLTQALLHYEQPPGHRYWPDNTNNWNQVCNAGVIVAAISVAETEPALAARSLAHAVRSLPNAMAEFSPDGGWKEGPGYWRYATLFNCIGLDALFTALGHDFGLSQAARGMERTGDFPTHLAGPTGALFNFGDSGLFRTPAPQLWWFARRYNDPAPARARLDNIAQDEVLASRISPEQVSREHGVNGSAFHYLDLIWYDHKLAEAGAPGEPTDRFFQGVQVVSMRTSWQDPDASWIAFKGAGSGCSHAHLDAGSFVFEALGERWAEDLGGDDYNLPGYFETWAGSSLRKYSYYRIRPEGHNTLVVNPLIGPPQAPLVVAPVVRTRFGHDVALGVVDLSPAYARQARSVLRGVMLNRATGAVLIRDEVAGPDPVDLWWFMHTRAQVTPDGSGRSAVLTRNGKRLWLGLFGPKEAFLEVHDPTPITHSPNPAGQATNAGYARVTIRVPIVPNPSLRVWLVPLSEGRDVPDTEPDDRPLASWW